VDVSGNIYVSGHFSSAPADFNAGGSGGTLTSSGGLDVFLAKYDAGGNYLWAKNMGGTGTDQSFGLAVDGNGNAYISGQFGPATANFNIGGSGADTLKSAGSSDIFLAKYDAAGNYLWAKSMGGRGADPGRGVAVDGRGNAYVTGFFHLDSADFNAGGSGGLLTSAGGYDVFLAKYDAAGNYLWAKNMGGITHDYGWDVAVDGSGTVYVTGRYTSTPADFNPGGSGGQLYPTGNADVFVVKFNCDTFSSHLAVSLCEDSYTLNDSIYTTSGIYAQVFPNLSGCDSTITLNLTLNGHVDQPVITTDSFTLGVAGSYAGYQWILNDQLITEATDPTYTVKDNGNYRVVVTNENGCSDTSDVYPVTNYTGIEGAPVPASQIRVYPNPATNRVNIDAPVPVTISLSCIDGKMILEPEPTKTVSLKALSQGIYFLHIYDDNQRLIKVEKVVKQ
jgi:hypothetical protein